MMGNSLSKLYITIGAKTEQFQRSMDQVSDRMQKVSKGMKIAGAAMTAVGVAGLKLSADARKLNATLGQTALNLNVTTKEMRDLALEITNVTFSLNEVVNTFDLLARAGVEDKEVLKAVSVAFDTLGDAIGVPASQVTAQLIPAMKTFNISAEEMAGKTDSLTWLFRNTTVNLEDFNRMVGYTTPELVAMGLTVEDMIAILAELEEQGYSGEVMTREFRKAVTLATKDQKPLNEALGISTEKIEGYKVEMEAATGITQKYADVANEQYSILDKLKHQLSKMAFVMGSFLTPLESILVAFTALGPIMIFLSTSIGIATVKWIAHTAAVLASAIAVKLATIAQWAWNVAMAANPIGAICLAIGIMVVAVVGISRAWGRTTKDVKRELEEQSRLIQEHADKQKQAIWDVYNQRIAVIDTETQAKIDALDAEADAIRKGTRDEQLAEQETAAIAEALAGDQTALIDWVKAARLAAIEDEKAALRASAEEQKLTAKEVADIDIAETNRITAAWDAALEAKKAYFEYTGTVHMTEWKFPPPPLMGNLTVPKFDAGGLITKPTLALLGERGPEMVIPLSSDSPAQGAGIVQNFPIATLIVREEADIKRIARELYNLQRISARAAGVA